MSIAEIESSQHVTSPGHQQSSPGSSGIDFLDAHKGDDFKPLSEQPDQKTYRMQMSGTIPMP